jgi:hypothetical protein
MEQPKPLTIADVLRKVYQTFVIEKQPRCAARDGHCVYSKKWGKKTFHCAIGCLLLPEHLQKIEEEGLNYSTPVVSLVKAIPEIGSYLLDGGVSIGTYQDLQEYHDNWSKSLDSTFPVYMKDYLCEIGRQYGVKTEEWQN